jgi:hypothetical protein
MVRSAPIKRRHVTQSGVPRHRIEVEASDGEVYRKYADDLTGGLSWTPDSLPSDVPQPIFDGLSCPTDYQCLVTGADSVPRQVGSTYDGGQPILLGTTDSGATWSNVTFSMPTGAPDAYGQSYLSLGGISCPSAGSCVALGNAAQSAPSSPVYRLAAQDRANRH